MRYFSLLFLFIGISFCAYTQSIKILDQSSKEPVPFVHIINQSQPNLQALFSNLDGQVNFPNSWKEQDEIIISCVGYEDKTDVLPTNSIVFLRPSNDFLEEVVFVAGENPAHKFIRKAIKKRKENDPSSFPYFQEEEYTKFIFTADTSDIEITDDSLKVDSNALKTRKFLSKQHFFILESLVQAVQTPAGLKEEVLANRVSGLQSPQFFLISSQIQSVSIYENQYTILDKEYVNPLAPGTFSRYFFRLEDSLPNDKAGKLYQISFRPKPKVEFDGLIGQIILDQTGNVISFSAKTPDSTGTIVDINIDFQEFRGKFIPNEVQSEVLFSSATVNGAQLKGKLRTVFQNRSTEEQQVKRSHIGLQFDTKEASKDSLEWEQLRPIPLNRQEYNTYQLIDSIGEENKFDERLTLFTSLTQGRLELGDHLSLRLNDILDYSRYAGFMLGIGAEYSFLKDRVKLIGQGKYGFKDKRLRYYGALELLLSTNYNWKLRGFVQSVDRMYGEFPTEESMEYSALDNVSSKWFQDSIYINEQFGITTSATLSKLFDLSFNYGIYQFINSVYPPLIGAPNLSLRYTTYGGGITFFSGRTLAFMNKRLVTIQPAMASLKLAYQSVQDDFRIINMYSAKAKYHLDATFSDWFIDGNARISEFAIEEGVNNFPNVSNQFASRPQYNPTNDAKYWLIEEGWNTFPWSGYYNQFYDVGLNFSSKRYLWRTGISEPSIAWSVRYGKGFGAGEERSHAVEAGFRLDALYSNSLLGVIQQKGNLGFYSSMDLESQELFYGIRFNLGF